MRAGQLRHVVNIQSYTTTTGAYSTKTWSTVGAIYASVKPLTGKELEHAMQIKSDATYQVICRYTDDINVKNRFSFKNKQLEILHIANIDERDKELVILCKEVI